MSNLSYHRDRLVSLRRAIVPHLLPPLEENYNPDIDPEAHLENALIDPEAVKNGLKDCGRGDSTADAGISILDSRHSASQVQRQGWQQPRAAVKLAAKFTEKLSTKLLDWTGLY